MVKTFFIIMLLLLTYSCAVIEMSTPAEQSGIQDTTAPSPGNLRTLQVFSASLILNWDKAVDLISPQANLQYVAFYSTTSNNLEDYLYSVSNATLAADWTNDIDSVPISGLTAWTTYYFVVFVKDDAENITNYNIFERITANAQNNYLPDPSFEGMPWGSSTGNAYWNIHWVPSGSGIQHQTGSTHIHSGSYGIYTYSQLSSTLENFTRLDFYDSTYKATKYRIPWSPGEAAKAYVWYKIWYNVTNEEEGNYHIKITFYSNNTKLDEYEKRAYSNNVSGVWETNNMFVITSPAPAKTMYAEVSIGVWKAAGPTFQLLASYDDIYFSVLTN